MLKSNRSAAFAAALTSVCVAFASPAFADTPKIDGADTAWMIVATALVLMMTIPGLALFYAGMVRKKNVLATMAQSLTAVALISILWVIFGYSRSRHYHARVWIRRALARHCHRRDRGRGLLLGLHQSQASLQL